MLQDNREITISFKGLLLRLLSEKEPNVYEQYGRMLFAEQLLKNNLNVDALKRHIGNLKLFCKSDRPYDYLSAYINILYCSNKKAVFFINWIYRQGYWSDKDSHKLLNNIDKVYKLSPNIT